MNNHLVSDLGGLPLVSTGDHSNARIQRGAPGEQLVARIAVSLLGNSIRQTNRSRDSLALHGPDTQS